jgi:hypothetical protein
MKKLTILLLILLAGCKKESGYINLNVTRDDFIGNYCGVYTREGYEGSDYNTTIRMKEPFINKIIIENFLGAGDIEAIIHGNTFYIPETTFYHHYASSKYGSYYYNEVLSGTGVLDISKYFLQINYTVRDIRENLPDQIDKGGIALYKSSKLSYLGNYSGDSASVIISSMHDSLFATITFQEWWKPYGWKNIKVQENDCEIYFSTDSINDISSGETYRLSGSGQKRGNQLRFSMRAYYHGISPLYFYDFTVTKRNN